MAFKVGDRVRIILGQMAGFTGRVKVIGNEPGKRIGIELDSFVDYGHSLDGATEERYDSVRDITVGRGWWVTEEEIEKL